MSNERRERDENSLVSAGYRDLARERTPASLDDMILRKARDAARPKYGRLRLWVRPLAWAATVAISLAIVLQVTQVPEPELPLAEPPQPAPKSETTKASRAERQAPAAGRLDAEVATDADAFVPASVDALREAEDMARMRSGSVDEAALSVAREAAAPLEKTAEPRYCDDEARATAESWAECIERLEADGKAVEARAERLVFEHTHPDY